MFLLILHLFFYETSLSSIGSLCQSQGGIELDNSCYCLESKLYINPQKQSCFSKTLQHFNQIFQPISHLCESTDWLKKKSLPDKGPFTIFSGSLCTHPARYICNPKLNEFIRLEEKNKKEFKLLELEADNTPELKKFVAEKSNQKGKTCFDLPYSDYVECAKRRNHALSQILYTNERKTKAELIFKKAQEHIIAFLEKRQRDLPALNQTNAKTNLKEMINQIKEAKPYFGALGSDDSGRWLSYNVNSLNSGHESQNKWFHIITNGNKTNTVFIEGIILRADNNPEALYRTYMHELSHFIDPLFFREDKNYSNHPFQKELQCLRRSDSSFAQQGDSTCLAKAAEKFKNTHRAFSIQALTASRVLKANPDIAWEGMQFPEDEPNCQMGQLREAFADWAANEAYLQQKDFPGLNNPAGIEMADGLRFINLRERLKLIPDLLESISSFCQSYIENKDQNIEVRRKNNKESHPDDEDRIDGVMLSHPDVKAALGCDSDSLYNLRDLKQPELPVGRVYCGKILYLNSSQRGTL